MRAEQSRAEQSRAEQSRAEQSRAEQSRIDWIDIAKGIAILLTIVGHSFDGSYRANILIYSFHMPLFFIISGLLIKENKFSSNVSDIFFSYFKSLMVPYFVFSFLTGLVEIAKDYLQDELCLINIISNFLRIITLQGILADWFLSCLFLSIVFYLILNKLLSNRVIVSITILCLSFVLCNVISLNLDLQYQNYLLVFLRAIVGASFVGIGSILRRFFITEHKTLKRGSVFCCFVLLLIMAILLSNLNGKVNLSGWVFGNSVLIYYINSIIGSMAILLFCISIDMCKLPLIKYCGKNSIIIMATHMEIIAVLGFILQKMNLYGDIFLIIRLLLATVISLALIPIEKFALSRVIRLRI